MEGKVGAWPERCGKRDWAMTKGDIYGIAMLMAKREEERWYGIISNRETKLEMKAGRAAHEAIRLIREWSRGLVRRRREDMCEWVRNKNLKGPWRHRSNPSDWKTEEWWLWEWTARKRGWDEDRGIGGRNGRLEELEEKEWEEAVEGIIGWAKKGSAYLYHKQGTKRNVRLSAQR